MPACLGNTATPHVPLLKKCHTGWYTSPRAWPGQRSGEASPGRAGAGRTNSCTSTWKQEAKTLNCQPAMLSRSTSTLTWGIFTPYSAGSLKVSEIISLKYSVLSSYQNGKVPTYLWGGFSSHTSSPQWAQLSCMQSLTSPALLLPCLATQISWGRFSLLYQPQVIFPWRLLHLPHYNTEHLQKHFQFQSQLFLSKIAWWLRVFSSF